MKIEIISQVIKTLNCVEVRGRENLDMLLGCINALSQVVEEMKSEEKDA